MSAGVGRGGRGAARTRRFAAEPRSASPGADRNSAAAPSLTRHPGPLNRERGFDAWRPLDPGLFLDMNPTLAVTATGDRWVLFCRYPVPPVPGLGSIWAVRVDDGIRPIGRPVLLVGDGIDPRIVACGERLFLFYARLERNADNVIDGSCVIAAEFAVADERWDCLGAYQLPKFPLGGQRSAEAQDKWEKNWVPFAIGEERIGLIYAHEPWDVITMDVRAGQPPNLRDSHRSPGLTWDYGTIRGGTPPVRYDDRRLITFFHAAQVIGSRRVYTVGACVFRDEAPYAPECVTDEPLLIAPYRSGAHRFGWNFAGSVVFPAGASAGRHGFTLVSGLDDGEIATFEVGRHELDERLRPATPLAMLTVVGARDGARQALPRAGILALPEELAPPDDGPIVNFARTLVGRGGTFVDIGTLGGGFSMALAPRFDRVVAFESDARLHDWFERNRILNGYTHVSCTAGSPGAGGVPALDAQGLGAVDLVRMEARGADLTPLAGASGLLARCRPVILCRTGDDPAIRPALERLMGQSGYAVEAIFPLAPAWVLCLPLASRQDFAWFV